jgi:hypothetical protein
MARPWDANNEEWAIVEGGGVSDRFETWGEAKEALDQGEYPEGAEVQWVENPVSLRIVK